MKKSKIIIPALALLAFTSISTVSGTVAWFTANRGATFTASTFEVVSADGNLKRSLASGTATTITKDGAETGNIQVTDASGNANKLSDASYDIVNGGSNIYTDVPNDDGSEATKFEKKDYTKAISTNVYYCATWKCTYTYAYGADKTNVNLYLDVISAFSSFDYEAAESSTSDSKTYKAFRVAIWNDDTTPIKRVLAPQQVKDKCTYVNTENPVVVSKKPTYATYTTTNLIPSDHSITKIDAGTKGAANRNDCFGTFTESHTSITLDFLVWFEGSDENTISGAEMDQVSMSFPFYTRLAA